MKEGLEPLFNPSSLALIGASKDAWKSGGVLLMVTYYPLTDEDFFTPERAAKAIASAVHYYQERRVKAE